tara:strand:+ start:10659 stop:12383 length:1725 start_codon:yes stop_codon:yes gene_type:complete
MAKKQSTGPNLLGIQKQMLDAGKDTRMQSLVQGAMGAFALNIAESEKQEATMEKHMEDLGGIENIVKLPMEQRGQVENFLRTNRDEYSNLAEQYAKSKDPAVKDKMNAIKYKFQTLDTELNKFAASKAEYMSDYEEGNLMKGGSFAKDNSFYMGMYGDPKTQFSIGETGEMSFTVNGETKSFKDAGSHTLRNYEAEKNIDTLFGTAADLKVSGKTFDKNRVANNFVNGHKDISKNDLSAILQTDLTGDGDKPSFMDQWAEGGLGDEFYKDVDKENITEEDVKALLKDKQRGLDLMGKYVGDISQGIYDNGELDETIALTREAKQASINASNRANRKNDGGGGGGGNPFNSKKPVVIDGRTVGNISAEDRYLTRQAVLDNKSFTGYHGYYEIQEDGTYKVVGNNSVFETDSFQTKYDILDTEGGRINTDKRNSVNENKKQGQLSWKELIVEGDDATSNKLNAQFNLNNNSEIKFVPFTWDKYKFNGQIKGEDWFGSLSDNALSNDIMAINPITNEVYMGDNGKPKLFKSRNSKGFDSKTAQAELEAIYKMVENAGELSGGDVEGANSSQDPLENK